MTSMNEYEIGNLIRLSAEFRDESDALVDPTTVTCQVKAPQTAPANLPVTRLSLGKYIALVTTAAPSGRWAYRFDGTGAVVAAIEGQFRVLGTDF